MGSYVSCVDCELMNKNWFILLVAFAGALALVCNCHLNVAFIEHFCRRDCNRPGNQVQSASTAVEYGARDGPHTWRSAANNQSPINIDSDCVELRCFDNPLMWLGYEQLPLGVRLENNGHTLVLRAVFRGDTPCIDGGDLLGRFSFHEISFRWSWYNDLGSEHTLDNEHFPLEMQCLHSDAVDSGHASSRGLLMVSYMYSLSTDNPFLDVIVQHLVAIQSAGQSVEIPVFPLNYLMPPFYTEFYSYHGSLTEPPCHRGAEWFIHPIPLAIGERQLHEFRKLRSPNGARITRNARPVQDRGDRTVHLNRYESSAIND
ncbi:hypothetical protein ACLKA7_000434 [Drosophila subpalustris]